MSLIKALLEKPPSLTTASKYTVVNGFIYLAVGFLLIVWPGVTQTLFRDSTFVGHEGGTRARNRSHGHSNWLALRVWRSFRRTTNRRRFRYRPIDIRPCCAHTRGNGRCVSAPASDIRGFRRFARGRRVGSLCSHVMPAVGQKWTSATTVAASVIAKSGRYKPR